MTQIMNAYNNVVLALVKSRKYVDIPLWELENHLCEFLGVSRQKVAIVHVDRMVRFGYLKLAKSGFPDQRRYDLVGKKVKELKKVG